MPRSPLPAFLLCLLAFSPSNARALIQNPAPAGGSAAPGVPAQPAAAATSFAAPKVTLQLSSVAYCGSKAKPQPCRLGSTLFVGFLNLKDWMLDSNNHVDQLVLVINDRALKDLVPRGPDESYGGLLFDLKAADNADSRALWNTLIPELRDNHQLDIAVASNGVAPFFAPPESGPCSAGDKTNVCNLRFEVFPSWTVWVIVLLATMLGGFIYLAKESDILRDAPANGGVKQSFSLARCQMAWWFFITLASYCYIWMTLYNYDSLTQGVLILTGISAATGLGATVIDSGKVDQRRQLLAEQALLTTRTAQLPPLIAAAAGGSAATLQDELDQKTKRLSDIATSLAALPSPIGASEGFFSDILRDESGISFHRFQMAGWTVILGLVFIVAVYSHLTMPDFSPTLLGLMGLSSGTYIGFKIPDSPK
jgi:hypothetical protein